MPACIDFGGFRRHGGAHADPAVPGAIAQCGLQSKGHQP